MSGKLYVVGTPIGNLGDLSERAKAVLSEVDFIAAEDTRVTLKLLNHIGVSASMISYHEHNKTVKAEEIIGKLSGGQNGALVTDAGMPAISDPGEDLVRLCHERGIAVESVPGPSALITALSISGMPSARFCFEGFLPTDRSERAGRLAEIKSDPRTHIFYEAPHKLVATLKAMLDVLGDRRAVLTRELTKLHETVEVTTLGQAVVHYGTVEPRGEYVVIIDGAKQDSRAYTLEDAVALARKYMEEGLGASSAAKVAASETGFRKGEIYKELIK